jgi:hypothetical protein
MSFEALLPDFDGPGTPFQIVDAGLLWGPAVAVPLSEVPDAATGQALLATLVAVDSTGDQELDGAVADVLACDLSGVRKRTSHAGSIGHALTASLFHLAAYANSEAATMLRYRQDGIAPPTGVATTVFFPDLVFNAEATVLQLRAALDALAAAAAHEGLNFHGRSSYGKFQARLRKWTDPRGGRLQPVVSHFVMVHSELEKIRNRIAHPSPDSLQSSFGTFALLPYIPTHRAGYVGLPQYEKRRAKDALVELEEATRNHIRDVLAILWGRAGQQAE